MSKVAKTTVILMAITMFSKVLGFVRELVLGSAYGATLYSDIYIISMNIPQTIFAGIGVALSTTFIPLYYENEKLGGREKALNFTNNMFNIVLVLGIILSIFVFVFAEPVVKVFAMGYEGDKFEMAVKFTRIMIFGGLFLSLESVIASVLQTKGQFIIPGMTGIPFNIIIIISIILSIKINIFILPIGTLIAIASKYIFQLPFAYKKGYRYKPILNLKDEYVKKVILLVTPVFIGVAVDQVNILVDRTLCSTLVEGSVSALNYANRLNQFVMGMFITTLLSVIYPLLSKLSVEDNKDKFTSVLVKSINSIILLVIPISIGAIVLSKPIVKLLFERGAFDARATSMTAIALCFYAVGLIGSAIRDVLSKVFYSLQDTKAPMVNGAIAMSLNIVLNIILIRYMGHAGLAFGTSLSSIICVLLLFSNLKRKIGDFGGRRIILTSIKCIMSAIVMGIVTNKVYYVLVNLLGEGNILDILNLAMTILVGAIVYGVLIILLKIEEVNIIIDKLKVKIKK